MQNAFVRHRDLVARTYLTESFVPGELNLFLRGIERAESSATDRVAVQYFCEHRFDLLGSGWTKIFHGMRCRGLEGISFPPAPRIKFDGAGNWLESRTTAANLEESQRIWSLVDPGYSPIDWHIDFKSGFRWNEVTWFRDIRFGNQRGVDVKVPWELSRLQHLPQIAIEFGRTHALGLASEIRNQMLDWIASNPPRFGVNWFSTMDVAIRTANMLVAYDLAVAYGAVFDEEFSKIFRRSILEHAHHIIANLEWNWEFRGNHYLADIAGLVFAAAYMDEQNPERDEWLLFAKEEIVTAVEEQFLDDGANFEGSTSYHRLSAEMVGFCTVLLRRVGFSEGAFPDWFYYRLGRMGDLPFHLSDGDGRIIQIGDNDSGRFLKLCPRRHLISCSQAVGEYKSLDGFNELSGEADYPDEVHLDHQHLLAEISAIVVLPDFDRAVASADRFVNLFTRCLQGSSVHERIPHQARESAEVTRKSQAPSGRPEARMIIPFQSLIGPVTLHSFPKFGAFAFESSGLRLCIRCGPVGQNGIGGHAHNDQLSYDLLLGNSGWANDPGTYLYTPLPERRNEHRSVRAHNGPRPNGREPGVLGAGLFRIVNPWEGECLEFSEGVFLGVMRSGKRAIYRRFLLHTDQLIIEDWASGCVLQPAASKGNRKDTVSYSPGYGQLLR